MNNDIVYLLRIIEELNKTNRYLTNKVADLEKQLSEVDTKKQLETAQKLELINKELKDILGDDFTKVISKLKSNEGF